MVIVALGLLVLASASEANGVKLSSDAYYFLKRQCVYLVAGIGLAAFVAWFDYRNWRTHAWLTCVFYVLVFGLLWAVF